MVRDWPRRLSQRLNRRITQYRWIQRPLLSLARLRLGSLRPGTTIVIVNWNSARFLDYTLERIAVCTGSAVRVLVVDNASRDDPRQQLTRWDRKMLDVRVLRLPINVGHATAMDIGFSRVRTQYAVALDVDAFPIAADWLEQLTAPLEAGSDVSGAHLRGGFVHPCCLAIRTDRFVRRRHTFLPRYAGGLRPDVDDEAGRGWDLGHLISIREPSRHLIDVTEQRGPGDVGTVFGGIVYHNFYSVRHQLESDPGILDGAVTQTDATDAWDEAVVRWGRS